MIRASCLMLCLVAASHQLSITDIAFPGAIKIGENAELQCPYSISPNEGDPMYVKWWWTRLNGTSDDKKLVYQRIGATAQLSPTFSNVLIKNNDTIELLDLQPNNSGTYTCEVFNGNEDQKHHDLVVYTKGSGPQLNITEVEDGPDEDEDADVQITCEASDVAPEPELLITMQTADDKKVLPVEDAVSDPIYGFYNISAMATVSKKDAVGAQIRCELYFINEKISHEVYSDTEVYEESGSGIETSTSETTEDTTQGETATEPLQRDSATSLSYSWALFVVTAGLTQLLNPH